MQSNYFESMSDHIGRKVRSLFGRKYISPAQPDLPAPLIGSKFSPKRKADKEKKRRRLEVQASKRANR